MNNEEARRELTKRRISRSKYSKALIEAIENDDTELMELLLSAGTNVNAANQYGRTPLFTAAWLGKKQYVQRLLEVPGIDVNRFTKEDQMTALSIAADRGYTECVRLLLAAPEIDLDEQERLGWSRLHIAASCGMTDWVLELLATGTELNPQNGDGNTPLALAAENSH